MKASKIAISRDAELADQLRAAAGAADMSVSAWIAEAVRAQLREDGLAKFLDDWEREHGAFTEEEIAQAEAQLGLLSRPRVR